MNVCIHKVLICTAASLVFMAESEAAAVDAQDCLAHYYMKSYAAALPLCIEAAEAGHEQSQFVLGLMYAEGKGMLKNDVDAAKWLEAAAQQGHAAARYKLQTLDLHKSDAARRNVVSTLWEKHTRPTEHKQTEVLKNQSGIEVFTEPAVAPVEQEVQMKHIDVKPVPVTAKKRVLKSTSKENHVIRRSQQYEGLNSLETAEIGRALAEDLAEDQQERERIRRLKQGL